MSMRLHSRKYVAVAALWLVGILVVAGCSSDDPEAKAPKTPSSSASATTPTIDPDAPEGILPPELRPNESEDTGPETPQAIPDPMPMAESGSVDCDGMDFNLTASDVTVTLEGSCGGIVVSGNNVVLNAASTLQTRIAGDNVTFNGGQVGWLVIEGSNAKVDLSIGYRFGIQFDGSNNKVSYVSADFDRIIDNGTGNSALRV